MNAANSCFACGYDLGAYAPWGVDGDEPSSGICPCCGCEFGNDDRSRAATLAWREEWARRGYPWWDRHTARPPHWDPAAQLLIAPAFVDYDKEGRLIDDPDTMAARRVLQAVDRAGSDPTGRVA